MRRALFAIALLLLLLPTDARSQAPAWNLDKGYLFHVSYGPFSSGGDLGDRFGNGFAIGGGVDITPANSPWQFGLMAEYGFGSTVKEDVLAGIRTDAGFIIGNQRQPAEVFLRQRQLFLGPRVGRTIPLGENPRAGVQLTTGLGYFFSRIRFQPDPVQYVPQIDPSLQAGYDRLAGGPALYQFVGYQQLSANRRLNFYLGGELTMALARQLRNFDVPTNGPPPSDGRLDVVLGIRAGLIVPVYRGEGRQILY